MQLMSWQIARLGSRFGIFFEPHRRRIMHSALGRLLDQPMELIVGLVEPDGRERVLPFCADGELFEHPEQFERPNSITYRAYCPAYGLSFEFNVHSVFSPQDEELCLMPAIYLEMRVNPADVFRGQPPEHVRPDKVKLFLRVRRDQTHITVSDDGRIDMQYQIPATAGRPTLSATDRIVSLNPAVTTEPDKNGLSITIPVTATGSGTKWRLVWGSFCNDSVLHLATGDDHDRGKLRYTQFWNNLDELIADAIEHRDERLARSRQFERAIEQTPLRMAQRHLIHQTFQTYLSSTFWCQKQVGDNNDEQWFGTWASSGQLTPSLEVEYHLALFALCLWPNLLAIQFDRWAGRDRAHPESEGSYLHHPDSSPVEENANFLLMLQAYTHWTGDISVMCRHAELIHRLANYENWTDRQDCAFPTQGGVAETQREPALARQTTQAIKRAAGLAAASDLLGRLDRSDLADQLDKIVQRSMKKIEEAAWLGDHYARSVDQSGTADESQWSDDTGLTYEQHALRDAYSINTGSSLLLPILIGQPPLLDHDRLVRDITGSLCETLGPYGCTECSTEPNKLFISHNLWRDHFARYMGMSAPAFTQCYWDLQTASNTGFNSLGFTDTYVSDSRCFSPRGVASMGYLLAYPRLVIDRLSPGGARISVDPDRFFYQRWPLLPLADWKLGKIPVVVVDGVTGTVKIECDIDPVFVRGEQTEDSMIG